MQICRYVVSPPGPCSAGAVWRCEDGNNTPLINRQRAPSLVSVESTTLSSPGPAAGSRLCSHILHILLFITTLSVLFKMLLCSLSSVYSIHYKKIYWRAWGISSDQVELILWSQHRLHSHVGWLVSGWGAQWKQYNDTMFDVFWRIVQTAALIMTLCCHTRYISAHWQGDAAAWKGSPPNLLEPTALENKTLPKF